MRKDFKIISSLIQKNSKVLDLGCGDGELLYMLRQSKNIQAKGIEKDPKKVSYAIAKGISVYQADMLEVLPNYKTKSYDYIILSQTLHEVQNPKLILSESLRVAKFVIVSFPNFGYIGLRIKMLISGNISNEKLFNYNWTQPENFHPLSISEFEQYCQSQTIKPVKKIYLSHFFLPFKSANVLAKIAIYCLSKD